MKPLIGIPTRSIKDSDGHVSYGIRFTYPRAIELAGGAPILIPLQLGEETLRAIFARLDGLLLAGGIDVHPSEYAEQVEPYCGEIDVTRDAIELRLVHWATEKGTPILGICRGIQGLNVAAGGTLYQDIPAQVENSLRHDYRKGEPYNLRAHSIEIDPQSRLAHALGDTHVEVNSLHHQSIKAVAPGFRVIARAPDGVIEGIEATNDYFALGVQFHPEWLLDDARMVRIFEEFVNASRGAR